MEFPAGETVVRLRPRTVVDRYSKKPVSADWAEPQELTIPGAYVGSSTTSRVLGESRTQMLEHRSLYCDAGADVQPFDRIQHGAVVYEIEGIPDVERNPFTGWAPVLEIPLRRVTG